MAYMRDNYEGECYDGPYEGRRYAAQGDIFHINSTDGAIPWWEAGSVAYPTVRVGTYVWSHSWRKWMWRGWR